MLDDNDNTAVNDSEVQDLPGAPEPKQPAKKATRKRTAKKAASTEAAVTEPAERPTEPPGDGPTVESGSVTDAPVAKKATKKVAAKRTTKRASKKAVTADPGEGTTPVETGPTASDDAAQQADDAPVSPAAAVPLFQAPEKTAPARKRAARKTAPTADGDQPSEPDAASEVAASDDAGAVADGTGPDGEGEDDGDTGEGGTARRRRRRGGRRRRKGAADGSDGGDAGTDGGSDSNSEEGSDGGAGDADGATRAAGGSAQKSGHRNDNRSDKDSGEAADDTSGDDKGEAGTRRRRRRRRAGEEGDGGGDDPQNTVTRVRKGRSAEDEITSLSGSTRLEAKKQRRREGREAGRRRAPIVSEAEFLARREAVDRVMVIRQRKDLTQIAVLEDSVLVEHYVARESQTSLIGNVYLGRVQNVLPSMEAAFVDIGKGRNAVLYAGEVNWDALGAGNGPRKIEQVLKSGQSILVQVTKDPIGHKGARLTSQVSLPGRFLVYVPDGTTSGISRKLPDTERNRLKTLLKEIVPDSAGVIVRTAAEGASEEELTKDVERLTARWADIESKVEKASKGSAMPQLLYGEPDLTLKVVRDLFTEDFGRLVVSGGDAWDMVDEYVEHVAPDLAERLERYDDSQGDVFASYRIDEQIAKGLDRKVWLPSGGSLIIDRTEAMTVVDVNTGKFTGSGGNLEETVTKNNLEAAEEIVRQLRLRDIGGIIVVDFIDMVLESNRDLVLRRLVECLGRDRTRHQVAEVTSLGLVQMTRKRIGTGLLEAFSESCEHCQGRGLIVHHEPIEPKKSQQDDEPRRGRRGRTRGRAGDEAGNGNGNGNGNGASNGTPKRPTPKDIAAMARHDHPEPSEQDNASDHVEGDATGDDQQAPAVHGTNGVHVGESGATDKGSTGTPEPAETPASADADPDIETSQPEAPAAPAGPVVVTSSRRRVARRPAGPPSGAVATATAQEPDLDLEELNDSDEDDTDNGGTSPHVPVKKRGRKR